MHHLAGKVQAATEGHDGANGIPIRPDVAGDTHAAGFARTIGDVLGLGPDRLSVFSYAHVPWIKPAQRIFDDRAQLPSAEEKLAMFALALVAVAAGIS